MKLDPQTLAKLLSLYAGIAFGIFWIPLRALDGNGFPGIWATLTLNLVPFAVCLPILLYRIHRYGPGSWYSHVTSMIIGLGFALYATAFVYTEVIRTTVLFYLMPLWGFLLGWVVLKDPITPIRWLSIGVGLTGMLILFGADLGIPYPRNIGDWMALSSGLLWALGALLILMDEQTHPLDYSLGFFFWSTVFVASASVIAATAGLLAVPDWGRLPGHLIWLIPVCIIAVAPAGFATVYGPSKLNPGVVGLLFMIEVAVATITAYLFANEPFGPREILGVVIVTTAGLLEPLRDYLRFRARAPAS